MDLLMWQHEDGLEYQMMIHEGHVSYGACCCPNPTEFDCPPEKAKEIFFEVQNILICGGDNFRNNMIYTLRKYKEQYK